MSSIRDRLTDGKTDRLIYEQKDGQNMNWMQGRQIGTEINRQMKEEIQKEWKNEMCS